VLAIELPSKPPSLGRWGQLTLDEINEGG
jgi:hypothetical protein